MRVAFVQAGPGLEPIGAQVARLKDLAPDRYQIEKHPTGVAAQRLRERLDAMIPGDELCLASPDVLRLEAGAALQLFFELVARGVKVSTFDDDQRPITLGSEVRDEALLRPFADLHRRRSSEGPCRTTVAGAAMDLLSSDEIDNILRLHRAGMSARRIGMIYHRSPRCISQVIWARGFPPTPTDAAPDLRVGSGS